MNNFHISLPNLGNTCWLNSCLQIYADLIQEFVTNQMKFPHEFFFRECFLCQDKKYVFKKFNDFDLMKPEYRDIFKQMTPDKSVKYQQLLYQIFYIMQPSFGEENEDEKIRTLTKLQQHIYSINNTLSPASEQDVHEALVSIFLGAITETPYHFNGKWYEMDLPYQVIDISILSNPDTSTKRRTIVPVSFDVTISLELTTNYKTSLVSIQNLIDNYQKEEMVSLNSKMVSKRNIIKLKYNTQFVFLLLKRFNSDGSKNQISITLNDIEIDCQKFKLISGIVHIGNSISNGHYIYVKYNPITNKPEFTISDNNISTKIDDSIIDMISKNVYVLLYKTV